MKYLFRIRAMARCCSPFFYNNDYTDFEKRLHRFKKLVLICAICFYNLCNQASSFGSDAKELYLKHCSPCHHPERYGTSAPPLFKETIGNKSDKELIAAISKGLPATNMQAFENILKADEIEGIIAYIKKPIEKPKWDKEDILSSLIRCQTSDPGSKAQIKVDLSNLFMIVEGGTGNVHFMDGDTFNLLDKIKVGAMHGGPKYDYNFNFSYILSRDGWLVKYDLKNLKEISRLRVGINSRNIAISGDGKYLAITNLMPQNIVFINTSNMEPSFIVDANDRVGAIYTLKEKGLFVAAMRDKPEIWLVDYKNSFEIKKLFSDQAFSDFFIEPAERYLIGAARNSGHLTVFDIYENKVVKSLEIKGMPHLASAAFWKDGDKVFAGFPNLEKPILTVIELYTWEIKSVVDLKGNGFFARTHSGTPYLWVDTGTDTIQLINKKTLKMEKEIVPEKGKQAMHTEFTKDGRFALVSIRDKDGAVIVYDEKLNAVKRLPFEKPIGKYNATNKTH
ncbi:MAG: c-type cytochrome [Deltaproteobacteria bacterium]|nr:c-type cytochrome [Deltaproteobacteria bacterium]